MKNNERNSYDASNYAIERVQSTQRTYKVYYRESTGQYLVASPDSDHPDNSSYFGRFVWNGARVQWINAKHEPKRVE